MTFEMLFYFEYSNLLRGNLILTIRNHACPNAENSGDYHGTASQPSSTPSIENEGEERVGG